MVIKQAKDFYAGLLFLLAGSAFAWGATRYTVGRAARMGPGNFPLMLGILLALLGAVMMLKALLSRTAPADLIGPWACKPLVFIIAANLVFGVLLGGLPAMGLMAAIGVYSTNNTWDIWMVGLFGVIGYGFIKLGAEPAPLLPGLILGPMMEENLRRALLLSRGDWSVFVTRGLSASLLAVAAALLLMVLLPSVKRQREETFVEE